MPFPYDLLVPAAALLVIAVAIFALRRYLRSAAFRGRQGEKKVARALRRCMISGDKLSNDVYLGDRDRSTQIDHILLSVRGVFVVETKNFSGDLYGDDGLNQWTQVLAGGNVVNEFYNPVRQNAGHISVLQRTLGTEMKMENLVVFVQGNLARVESGCVYSLQGLQSHLRALKQRRVLTERQRDEFYQTLQAAKENPVTSKRRHRRNVKRRRKQERKHR